MSIFSPFGWILALFLGGQSHPGWPKFTPRAKLSQDADADISIVSMEIMLSPTEHKNNFQLQKLSKIRPNRIVYQDMYYSGQSHPVGVTLATS